MARENQFVPTGVPGLDYVLLGGLLREWFYLVQGDPGSGKTTLALQFVLGRRDAGERSLYISLTESRRDIDRTCQSHGWKLDGVEICDLSRSAANLSGEPESSELRKERVLLADVIASAVETARPLIEAADHQLEISLPPRPTFLNADLTRLAQVFSNLLVNSAKYTQPGGRLEVLAERRDSGVCVTVRDNGIGIPESALPHIFDMFSQVDRSIERSTGGLGIGLALVKGIVEMHGGTVSARSAGEGKGSEFTVCLPVIETRPTGPNDGSSDCASHGPSRRMLVVDDNPDGAASMAMMLQLMGDEVRIARDGVEAIEAFESFHPEVILMDIGMPRLNGLEATKQIRERPFGNTCTIIAVTGWGQDGDIKLSREAGCNGHLVKPVNLADLEKLLNQARS